MTESYTLIYFFIYKMPFSLAFSGVIILESYFSYILGGKNRASDNLITYIFMTLID